MTPFYEDIIREDMGGSQVERGYYLGSDGKPKLISEMNVHNLKNALAKLERDEPYRIEEIADLQAETARRDAEFQAQQDAS